MKGKQNISCFRCIYLLVVYLLGKGVSWIGVTSKHWQRYEGRRSLMLLNKNQADLRWTWNSTAKESNWAWKPCKEKQNYPWWDFWIHITEYFKNPKLKNQAMKGFWGKPLFLTYVVGGRGGRERTTSEWPKLVSETIFLTNWDISVLKSGARFLFWAPEVPEPNQNENRRPLFLKIL